MREAIRLRPHHFFDVMRAFGIGEEIGPHPYGHSFHEIAELIRSDPEVRVALVISCDDMCKGCSRLKDGHCEDLITHRTDFTRKESFNDYIDRRIIEKCRLEEGMVMTPARLCQGSSCYLDNIGFIYSGNDKWHTRKRKENVKEGLRYYSRLHNLALDADGD